MRRVPDTSTSRRALLCGFAGSLAGLTVPRWISVGYAADGISLTPMAEKLTLLTGAGCNVLVLTTSDGQVLVDTGEGRARDALLSTLNELPGEGVTAVFNTHWHREQVGSNEALGNAGATIFAHEKTRLKLATGYYLPDEDRYQAPLPAAALPTETFYDAGATVVGGQRIEYGYLIAAHTDGDIYVAFPELNVIATGDIISPESDPIFDWFGGGWLGGRIDALARLLELGNDATRFVPGNGPVVSRAAIQTEHDTMLELFERMVEHIRLGESPEDLLETGVLEGLGRSFNDPYRLVYDLHKGFWAHHNKLMHDIV